MDVNYLLKYISFFSNYIINVGLSSDHWKPLYCQGYQIGLLRPEVENAIKSYKDVFKVSATKIGIVAQTVAQSSDNNTFEEIS